MSLNMVQEGNCKSLTDIFCLKLSIFILQPSVLPKIGIEFNQKFKWWCKQYYLDSVRFGSWKSFDDNCCDLHYFRQILVNRGWFLDNLDFLHPWRSEPAQELGVRGWEHGHAGTSFHVSNLVLLDVQIQMHRVTIVFTLTLSPAQKSRVTLSLDFNILTMWQCSWWQLPTIILNCI